MDKYKKYPVPKKAKAENQILYIIAGLEKQKQELLETCKWALEYIRNNSVGCLTRYNIEDKLEQALKNADINYESL